MSLLSHCGQTVTAECVAQVIRKFPEYTTVMLFGMSLVYYDVTFFWLSLGLMLSYGVNILLNLIVHPHDAIQVIFGTAGYLGNPSFQSQYCVNIVLLTVMFFHTYRNHVPAYGVALLYAGIIAVMFATVYLTNEAYESIYTGAVVGLVCALVSMFVYYMYLEPLSDEFCMTWFGKINGLRNSYAKRRLLDDPEMHRRVHRMQVAGGYTSIKEMLHDLMAFNATIDEQEGDPVYHDPTNLLENDDDEYEDDYDSDDDDDI